MIPFKFRSTRTLAPATGWAGTAPWAMPHQEITAVEPPPKRPESTPPVLGATEDPHQGCPAASWAY